MLQEKSKVYSKAFVELNEIINNMDENLKNKIPAKLKEDIKRAGDKNYKFSFDKTLKLSEQILLPETKSLLSIIYSDYLCSKDEKKKWEEYDKFEIQKQEELKSKKYITSNFFENTKSNKLKDISKELKIVEDKKTSFWNKLKNFILKLLKRK